MFWFEQFLYLTTYDVLMLLGSALAFFVLGSLIWLNRKRHWLSRPQTVVFSFLYLFPIMIAFYAFFVEPNLLVTRTYDFDISNVTLEKPIKIAVVGDMQARAQLAPSFVPYSVARINETQADYVFWVGDLIEAHPEELPLFDSFKDIRAKQGKYAILGNHDYGNHMLDAKGKEIAQKVANHLRNSGFVVLKNTAILSEINGYRIGIGGTDDLWTTNVDFESLNRQTESLHADFNLLLAHQPMTAIHNKKSGLYAIEFSGHCHGGQINLIFLNRFLGFPHVPPGCSSNPDHTVGLFEEYGQQIFLTPGIGSLFIRARLFDKPEISVVNLY